MDEMLLKARALAEKAHAGQIDKAASPIICIHLPFLIPAPVFMRKLQRCCTMYWKIQTSPNDSCVVFFLVMLSMPWCFLRMTHPRIIMITCTVSSRTRSQGRSKLPISCKMAT